MKWKYKMKLVKNLWREQAGMVSLSALLILSVLVMVSLYVYDILQFQISSLQNFKLRMEAQNYTYDCANTMIKKYQDDYFLWKQDIEDVADDFNFKNAKIVGEYIKTENFGEQSAKLYLFRYHDNFYILVVEVCMQDITNQMRIYLKHNESEGNFNVYRYER